MSSKYKGVAKDFGGTRLTNIADGSADNDAASFGQTKALLNGISNKDAVTVATTTNIANLASPGSAIDSITLTTNMRVLVKDQSTQTQNGIYTYNGSALVRANDMLTGVDARAFTVAVRGGTTNDDTRWSVNSDPAIVGTNNIVWTDITSGTAYIGGAGLTLTGATFAVGQGTGITVNADDVALAATAAGGGLTHTAGVLAVGAGSGITVNADDVALASTAGGAGLTYTTGVLAVGAGTGITVNADDVQVNTSVVMRKYSNASIGDGSTTSIGVTHGISGGVSVIYGPTLMDNSTKEIVEADYVVTSSTVVTVLFNTAPTTNQYTLSFGY